MITTRTRRPNPIRGLATAAALALVGLITLSGVVLAIAPPAGPPFPDPVQGQAVYDYAGVFKPETITEAEATIKTIETRSGVGIVVYTQDAGYFSIDSAEAEAAARALGNQWGVGRKGFDDGLVIFFDLDPSLQHGQVQLYAGQGFASAYLSNSERQAIFDNEMLPRLRSGDLDGALLVALGEVDAAVTPQHAAQLEQARQINAVLGLIGAPIAFLGLAGWAFLNWRRTGKDPVYLDDPSILMPAPPPNLTAASGALIQDGRTSRRALTTAMLDLASRGLLSFREDKGLLGMSHKVGVDMQPAAPDDATKAQQAINQRRPTGPAEQLAYRDLRKLASTRDTYISPDDLPKFGASVGDFDEALETHVVTNGWFAERPSQVVTRWAGRAIIAIVFGVIVLFLGLNIPISGLTVIGVAIVAGGVVIMIIAQFMPAVTKDGSMIRAMLAAYRRTLQKTMEQARSMQQVVDGAGLSWLQTPDQAVVWGTALGLQSEIEGVLSRSLEDVQSGRATNSGFVPYFPIWYGNSSGASLAGAGVSGPGGSLFSGSGIPDLGGMMSALGTIGNSPSSSGSGGGGSFGGGGFSGGGGAGGGF